MIVKCIANDISFVKNKKAAERLRRWVNSEGVYNDLDVGQEYQVQAVDYFEGGVFYYLHLDDTDDHPLPYASEFFVIEDSSFPASWEVGFHVENGKKRFKRLTFQEWVEDDMFYEKLLDGETEYVSMYLCNRLD
jgi:hypothetical protein